MGCTITAVGAGSAISTEFDNSNFIFEFANGKRYLLDCGITFPKKWKRELGTCHFDGILITHTHADHVGGLDEVVVEYRKSFKEKIDIYLMQDVFQFVWDWKLRGGLKPTSDDPLTFFRPHFDRLPPEFERGQWLRTHHVVADFPSYGLAFEVGDKLIWISGDSSFMPEKWQPQYWQQRFGRDMPDLILHEVIFDDASNKSHTYYGELQKLDERWRLRTWLYHYPERERDVEADGFAGYIRAASEIGGPCLTL